MEPQPSWTGATASRAVLEAVFAVNLSNEAPNRAHASASATLMISAHRGGSEARPSAGSSQKASTRKAHSSTMVHKS